MERECIYCSTAAVENRKVTIDIAQMVTSAPVVYLGPE